MTDELADLVRRHRVDPGRLVHVGTVTGREIPAYYDAGYVDITVVCADQRQIRAVRTRFPGVDAVETRDELASTSLGAHTFVVNVPGHELALMQFTPWTSSQLLIVATSTADTENGPSSCDLVTETVTTRGFVEVDRWERSGGGGAVDVAFLKVAD